jgi:flagellin
LQSAKTETAAERKSAAAQFNNLATQLNGLLNDASYQGLNLVNSTATSLTLQFSQTTTSTLKIAGENLLISASVTAGALGSVLGTALTGTTFSTAVSNGKTSVFDVAYKALTNAISTFQSAAASLGSNVSFLQTRLNFTEQYIATLQGGANKLTVADVNQESTNLVTLQTRQQLAIQSLSIATQSEQAVLRLFHSASRRRATSVVRRSSPRLLTPNQDRAADIRRRSRSECGAAARDRPRSSAATRAHRCGDTARRSRCPRPRA